MANHIYYRMLGNVATIFLHVGNIASLLLQDPKEFDEDLRRFWKYRVFYFTGWTMTMQLTCAFISLYCDFLTLKNSSKKNFSLPKYLSAFRDTLFSAIVFPSCFAVITIFWSVWSYDRELIFPTYLDKVLGPFSNHAMHTAIVPLALWQVCFNPQPLPRWLVHAMNFALSAAYLALYIIVLEVIHWWDDHWLYPVFNKLYEANYLNNFYLFLLVLIFIGYSFQWLIVNFLFGKTEKSVKKH